MAADFVPLFASIPNRDNPGRVQPTAPATTRGNGSNGHPGCGSAGEVKVELKREGERITQIRVQCRCGEVIELECEY